MKVQATQLGFDGDRRRKVGDVFTIPDHLFSSKWMVNLDESEEEEVKPRRGRKPKEAEKEVDQGE
jgi:hypothetical protein